MKLLVDVGNSRVKWAVAVSGRLVTQGDVPRDEPGPWRLPLEPGQIPDEIRIANVAGAEVGARIAAALKERFGVAPVLARAAATGAGVRNGYTDPGQLGADRWLAICAAFAGCRAPVCVVDAGTATTIDLVTGSGEHRGGLILPGLELMQAALLRGTGDLARLSGARVLRELPAALPADESPIALGRDTAAAIRYGALQATACLVLNCMDGWHVSSAPETTRPVLMITGGAAADLQAALQRLAFVPGSGSAPGLRLEHRPQLVLEGLALEPPCFVAAG